MTGSNTRAADTDRLPFRCGGSLFNMSGQRLNEIDLDTYEHPKPVSAREALHRFDAGER